MEDTQSQHYLRKKYKQLPQEDGLFDPWVNPDEGHIPQCASCSEVFEKFKKSANKQSVEFEHTAACLWYDYFRAKIRAINQNVVFTLKRDKDGAHLNSTK